MSRPRVLFLTQVLPYPLDAGPKVRAYHVLAWLAARFDVHLVSFVRADDPPEAVAHLRTLCADVTLVPMRRSRLADSAHLAAALLRGRSFVLERDESREMRRAVRTALIQPSAAVHADQLWMARFARDLPVGLKVLDNHNAVFRIFQRLAANEPNPVKRVLLTRDAGLIAAAELSAVWDFDATLFVSQTDRDAVALLSDLANRAQLLAKTRVVPISLDTAAQQPVPPVAQPHRVTILGTMFWPPNAEGVLWLAHEVWPQVLAATATAPSATRGAPQTSLRQPVLTIIGKRPPEAIQALERRFVDSVQVAGYADDLVPYLRETAVFAVPLLSGGGMRVKILDAWAWGLPVVSTSVGAEGIDVTDGRDIILADSPAEFADAITTLLADPVKREALSRAGRATVEERYDHRRQYEVLAEVYAPLLESSPAL